MKTRQGPPLEALTRHLSECPAEFLAEPRIGKAGLVATAAVAADLLRNYGTEADEGLLAAWTQAAPKDRARLKLVQVACWFFHYDGLHGQASGEAVTVMLRDGLGELADLAPAERYIQDPDRREEFTRVCLQAVGLRPAGETDAQAQDRLTTLNSAERRRVVAAARKAEARASEIRRKMAEEAARRAESKSMPE